MSVQPLVMLLKLGMTVRPFAIVFAVDSLIVTDVRPIPVVVVSTVFEDEGFQMGEYKRAGTDIFVVFHFLKGGVTENIGIQNNFRSPEESQHF